MLAPESTCCVLFKPICLLCIVGRGNWAEPEVSKFMLGTVQAEPSKLTDSMPIEFLKDVKRIVVIPLNSSLVLTELRATFSKDPAY
jgi:hypothetical protein